MVITLDIGNSYTKVGLYDGNSLIVHDTFAKEDLQSGRASLVGKHPVDAVAISTVGRPDPMEDALLASGFPIIRLTHDTPLPFTNDYLSPDTLGLDRIADMLGAYATHPGVNDFLILDLGTCNTYDTILRGHFVGGNIAPGLKMRLDAMHEHTAALPLVKPHDNYLMLGRTTQEAMECGSLIGVIDEINGQISRFRADAPEGVVLLTGGYSDFVAGWLCERVEHNPYLVFDGLNFVAQQQVKTAR